MIDSCAAIVIAAKHHELTKVKDTRGTTNTVGALRCRFEFRTTDWDYSAKTAMFCNGDAILHPEVADLAIAVPLDEDNECEVPYEVLTDTLPYSVGVWGTTKDGIRIVSRWIVFGAQLGCYTEGNAPADPKPTVYEQILTTSQQAVTAANDVVKRANSGEFDGRDGSDGKDGETPYIGRNNNWWIGDTDTGIKVSGVDGTDGYTPQKNIDYFDGKDGRGIQSAKLNQDYTLTLSFDDNTSYTTTSIRGLSGANGVDGKDGIDGQTPYIGENGNWWIGGADTGVKSIGSDGKDGYTPQKGIDYFDGRDGVNGKDGYTPKKGIDYFDGRDGENGKDGYTPQKGVDYFDGKDGADGKNGVDGKNGADGIDGRDGADGYTPVKGKDYFTEAERADMVKEVQDEAVGDLEASLDGIIALQEELMIPDGDEVMY